MKMKMKFGLSWNSDRPASFSAPKSAGSFRSPGVSSVTVSTGISILLILTLCSFPSCSDRTPTQDDFIDWISDLYREETGFQADDVMVCRWERISEDITRLAPEVDGLRVEAALFSTHEDGGEDPLVHYVFCRYYLVTDEWYLHASSWGSGFWIQDPEEWGHLMEECQHRAVQIKDQKDRVNERE